MGTEGTLSRFVAQPDSSPVKCVAEPLSDSAVPLDDQCLRAIVAIADRANGPGVAR
jgi:hypothetical protein